jgi:diaminohydroxyphosphoribosylaminopyrimidine deaminase/5-amino-6-(5-phosphoribosylamino)uracil reductase
MVAADDLALMTRALFLAERGLGRTAPNPIVGAVVVTPGGVIVGQGAHLEAGGPHAEVVALDQAGGRARGATLYCTLEPCSHHGRTGPCVERIVGAGVARVVVAHGDPNPRVAGAGLAYLRARGVAVEVGVGEAEAARQNAAFFVWVTEQRPFVILKSVVSCDGFVGRAEERMHLSGAAADRFFHRQRAAVDAIAVGSGTARLDDPLLTPRGAYRHRPLTRVIFDWRARVPPDGRVFSTLDAGPVIMIVLESAVRANPAPLLDLERRGVIVERRPERDLVPVLRWLAARDIVTLLVEGGPALHAAFAGAGLVDRVQVVVTPHELRQGVPGWDAADSESSWRGRAPARMLGDDRLIEFDVHRTG